MPSSKIEITNKTEKDDVLSFTISNVDVCYINALRRTIITNIPVIVFNSKNCIVYKNTIAGVTNEYIKHRLTGIPIYIKNTSEMPIQNYIMELDIENDTDNIITVTSKDFKIKNINTGEYLSEKETHEIFPPNIITNDYMLFLNLKPQLATNIPGEAIKLSCNFSYEQCGADGMYSVTSTCSFANAVDNFKMKKELEKKRQQWKDEKMPHDMIELNSLNWEKTDGMRICTKDSFNFYLESNGVYTNKEILHLACDYLIEKSDDMIKNMEKYFKIEISKTTCLNTFDIYLNNNNKEIDEYTFGNILNHLLFEIYYETLNKNIKMVGVKKLHPSDDFIKIRVSYNETTENSTVFMNINECLNKAKETFIIIKKLI